MDSEVQELRRRIAALELRERRARWGTLLALAAGLVFVVGRPAQTQQDGTEVRAPFRVVDAQGKPLLVVERNRSERATSQLRLLDADGKNAVAVSSVAAPYPVRRIDLFDSTEKWATSLLAEKTYTALTMYNRGAQISHPGVVLSARAEEGGQLAVFDQKNKTVVANPKE